MFAVASIDHILCTNKRIPRYTRDIENFFNTVQVMGGSKNPFSKAIAAACVTIFLPLGVFMPVGLALMAESPITIELNASAALNESESNGGSRLLEAVSSVTADEGNSAISIVLLALGAGVPSICATIALVHFFRGRGPSEAVKVSNIDAKSAKLLGVEDGADKLGQRHYVSFAIWVKHNKHNAVQWIIHFLALFSRAFLVLLASANLQR